MKNRVILFLIGLCLCACNRPTASERKSEIPEEKSYYQQ